MSGERASVSTLLGVGSPGALRIIDRAAHVVRGDARALYGAVLPASGGLALAGLSLYHVERVLGISTLRPAFGVVVAALLALRAVTAGAVARHVAALAEGEASTLRAAREALRPRRLDLARAGVFAALLDLPMILLAAWMTQLGPLGAVLLVPVMGLRWVGASPTWIARFAVTDDGVGRAWVRAWRDGQGGRGKAMVVETLLGVVALLVFFNGYVALLFGAGIGSAVLGLDLAFAASFLSPSNGFAITLLLVGTLVVVEPLRMVASALLWVDARVRHDALDLRRRIDALTAEDGARRPARPAGAAIAAALLLALTAAFPSAARAQDVPVSPSDVVEIAPLPDRPPSAGDAERHAAEEVLATSEFARVPQAGEGHADEWLRELIRDTLELLMPDPNLLPDLGFDFGLPGMTTFLVIGAIVFLGALAFTIWAVRSSRRRGDAPAAEAAAAAIDVRERDPVDILAEASALRRRGELRAALRTVYLATLVQLDRRREIVFDPSRTNWQYLRDFPAGERKDRFASLTRLFDHKWYGHEAVSDEDVGTADRVARALLDAGGGDDVAPVA